MAGILDLLGSDLGKQIISGVSGQTGASSGKTADVLGMALPILMGAMQKNASTPDGAAGILGALSGKHSGGILDDLGGLFGGGVDQSVQDDGANILGHILGGKQANVETQLSNKSGLDMGTIGSILKVAAPILMGVVGKQVMGSGGSSNADAGVLSNVLGGFVGGGTGSKQQSMIESLLDADGDGSIIDDVAGMLLSGGGQKKGGLGSLLGGLFGK